MGQGAKKVEQGTQTKAKTMQPEDNDRDHGQSLNSGQDGRQGLDEAWRPTDADQQQGNSQQMEPQDPNEGDEADEDLDEDELDADEEFEDDDDEDSDAMPPRDPDGSGAAEGDIEQQGGNRY